MVVSSVDRVTWRRSKKLRPLISRPNCAPVPEAKKQSRHAIDKQREEASMPANLEKRLIEVGQADVVLRAEKVGVVGEAGAGEGRQRRQLGDGVDVEAARVVVRRVPRRHDAVDVVAVCRTRLDGRRLPVKVRHFPFVSRTQLVRLIFQQRRFFGFQFLIELPIGLCLLGFTVFLPSFTGFYLVLLGFYWVLPISTGFYLVLSKF